MFDNKYEIRGIRVQSLADGVIIIKPNLFLSYFGFMAHKDYFF